MDQRIDVYYERSGVNDLLESTYSCRTCSIEREIFQKAILYLIRYLCMADLTQFRKALQDLTRQVDELERIKNDFHRHMFDTEQRNFNLILAKAGGVVRAEVDVYERIANKGMADPVLEQVGRPELCITTKRIGGRYSEKVS